MGVWNGKNTFQQSFFSWPDTNTNQFHTAGLFPYKPPENMNSKLFSSTLPKMRLLKSQYAKEYN